ncbi:MAG: ABC transporter substrate-binding protein [Thermodesulfobacteriota bacterium]|nr:ABC transporter substrate-binding protein [Thermodesulfobacteriota bacterium]
MKERNALTKVVIFALILTFIGGTYASAGGVPGVSKNKIKLGHIGDLTGPGAYVGNLLVNVTHAFFKNVNDKGGIHGRKVEFITEDHKYSPTKAVAAFKYLISRHNIFAIHNITSTVTCAALFPYVAKEKIPVFPTTAMSTLIYTPPKRYIFSMTSIASDEVKIVVDYIMKDLKAKNPRLAICYQDDEWGKDGKIGMEKAASEYGLKLVAAEPYKRGSIDLSSQAVRFKMAKAEYIFCTGYPPTYATLMKECRKIGMSPKFFGNAATAISQTLKLAGEAARDSMYIGFAAMPQEDVPGMVELKSELKKYRPEITINPLIPPLWAGSLALKEALKRAGRDLTREGLIDALESFKGFETGGLAPPITYGPTSQGPISRKGLHALKVLKADIDKKIFIPVTDWRKTSM